MDARERLRRYLEQRREMGEHELVLDSLSIEEVMRLLGAARGRGTIPVERERAPRCRDTKRATARPNSA